MKCSWINVFPISTVGILPVTVSIHPPILSPPCDYLKIYKSTRSPFFSRRILSTSIENSLSYFSYYPSKELIPSSLLFFAPGKVDEHGLLQLMGMYHRLLAPIFLVPHMLEVPVSCFCIILIFS